MSTIKIKTDYDWEVRLVEGFNKKVEAIPNPTPITAFTLGFMDKMKLKEFAQGKLSEFSMSVPVTEHITQTLYFIRTTLGIEMELFANESLVDCKTISKPGFDKALLSFIGW